MLQSGNYIKNKQTNDDKYTKAITFYFYYEVAVTAKDIKLNILSYHFVF